MGRMGNTHRASALSIKQSTPIPPSSAPTSPGSAIFPIATRPRITGIKINTHATLGHAPPSPLRLPHITGIKNNTRIIFGSDSRNFNMFRLCYTTKKTSKAWWRMILSLPLCKPPKLWRNTQRNSHQKRIM